ncbi:MAG: hypothetical protein R3B70_36130 [Polyangiaceae bacterium]
MKMVIYQPMVAEGYEWINALRDGDYEVFLQLDGKPRASTWQPIAVRRVRADKRQAFLSSDFPWLGGHALVMRRSAVDTLRDTLDENGEVLPLSTDDGVELFVLNARVIDALDEARSSLLKFPGTNRIMRTATGRAREHDEGGMSLHAFSAATLPDFAGSRGERLSPVLDES